MDTDWQPLLQRLQEATERLGPCGRLLNAIALLKSGEKNPSAHLDMRLCGNGPTFREAANSALAWAESQEV